MEAPAPVLAAVGMLVLDSAELSARALRATAAAGCGRADAAGAARRNATSSSATTTCLRVLHMLINYGGTGCLGAGLISATRAYTVEGPTLEFDLCNLYSGRTWRTSRRATRRRMTGEVTGLHAS